VSTCIKSSETEFDWISFRFWESNEPNNANGNEDCIELNPAKLVLNNWNDIPCSAMRKWICEK